MKKRLEHEELLSDVLAETDDAREATLHHGLTALRRARARHRAARLTLAVLPLLLLAALWIVQSRRAPTEPVAQLPKTDPVPPTPTARMIAGTPIRVLSDEELLALFKDRPVALLGRRGHQRLVLLDEVVR